MVKKLFKHEFIYYARIMVFVYAILLTIATAGRVIQIFENDSIAYQIVNVASILTYGFAVWAALVFGLVLAIIRFYKNLFTAEGYLSFTLPVTAGQHIAVKVVTAVCVDLITTGVILISGCILTAGEMLKEICIALNYLAEKLYAQIGGHMVTIGLEFVLWLLVASASNALLYYTFIAIGQLFRKARILASVGAYFAYYILVQIVSTGFSIVFSTLAMTGIVEKIGFWIYQHPFHTVHICMWVGIVFSAACAVVEFLVVRRIATKKLNLE